VEIDKVILTKPIPRQPVAYDAAKLRQVPTTVDCNAKVTKVSPYIYGFAYYPFNDAKTQEAQWAIQGTVRRWGGNNTSTYNWEIGAWNTSSDWFYENHEISHELFLSENAKHGVASAVTVPIMGWVAKDTTSSSFPVSAFDAQEAIDQYRPTAGNGKDKAGKLLKPGPQSLAFRPITPEFVKRWVQAIRQNDAKTGKRSVWMYILDNEPMIWHLTHRDAHPEPLGYDELVARTIEYGTAIREADPDAVIAGPAEWGWMGYMFSSKDQANGGPPVGPDRKAHGDLPVVAYYLRALAEHEKRTGIRVLDVFDLHMYPYVDGVYSPRTDPPIAALRIRSTRMLWDPDYADESWVKEPVMLLPRMREWVDKYYPGRGISLGEWSFGGELHASGALSIAESLGRFAQFGVTSAFYWTYPPLNSPAMWAFRAYRDYDGKGSHFLDWYTPSSVGKHEPISIFASRDESGKHLVAVLINSSPQEAVTANINLSSCGEAATIASFTYDTISRRFVAASTPGPQIGNPTQPLPPYSITVLDVQLKQASKLLH